jgi:hypothetical protein
VLNPPGTFKSITNQSLVYKKHPTKNWDVAMWPLAAGDGAAGRIPARPAAGLAGRWTGNDLGAR